MPQPSRYLRNYVSAIHPARWRASWDAARTLWFSYGHLRSVRTQASIDSDGPVPWYTYPAIEYLKQLDFSDCDVFEYGSGNSTLFWASVAKRVVSVEEDPEWFEIVGSKLPPNCELLLETDLARYPDTIASAGHPFDVIVIDGAARGLTRLKCSRAALPYLGDGGMIILDNSDWLPESARLLREADLIQVDMTGFAPITGHTQTTSFFLHRAFRLPSRASRQPMPGPGAAEMVWEHPPCADLPRVTCGDEVFGGVKRDVRFSVLSPSGAREFRFVVAEDRRRGMRTTAVLDLQRARVLLSVTEKMDGPAAAEKELEPLIHASWAEFTRLLNTHDKRRCDIPLDGAIEEQHVPVRRAGWRASA